MYFTALAADFDGTIAHDGKVDKETIHALKDFKESARRLVLVTGRQLNDLLKAFPGHELFDRIVAENGTQIYDPDRKQGRLIGPAPSHASIETLKRGGVEPLSVGRCIVATWEPNETIVLEVIRELGLELQIIFNKRAVMVLPSGIDKATAQIEQDGSLDAKESRKRIGEAVSRRYTAPAKQDSRSQTPKGKQLRLIDDEHPDQRISPDDKAEVPGKRLHKQAKSHDQGGDNLGQDYGGQEDLRRDGGFQNRSLVGVTNRVKRPANTSLSLH